MKYIFETAGKYWKDSVFVLEFIKASSFFALALIVNYYAVRYATMNAGQAVPDIFLNHIPRVDTYYIDYYVSLYLQYFIFLFVILFPRYSVFFIKTFSMLVICRSFFVNLTNLGIPVGTVQVQSFFTTGGDLFFSGHTALPCVAMFIFWDMKFARYFFLFLTLFMGSEVLLGHYHYSIDVFAAPFIAYGVFTVSKFFFKKDYDRIVSK
jgi:hypothetical protein